MNSLWKNTAALLAGSLLLLVAGGITLRSALARSRGPQGLAEAAKILAEMGGESGLDARRQKLAEAASRLELERRARSADADAFSRRLEATFGELGLTLTSSSEWKPVPKFKGAAGTAAFERSFGGSGTFDRLLDAILSIESWPDQARIRDLSVTTEGKGAVAFTLQVTVVRLAALAAKEKK